jgi:hypothetical protein
LKGATPQARATGSRRSPSASARASFAWVATIAADLSGAAVTAQNRVRGTTPTLRVGDYDAPGEPYGFGCACNVWSSLLGLGESSLHRREPRRDLSATLPRDIVRRGHPRRQPDRLVKRLVWRLQSLAEGDLSERARCAAELVRDAVLRLNPPVSNRRHPRQSRSPNETLFEIVSRESRAPLLSNCLWLLILGRFGFHRRKEFASRSGFECNTPRISRARAPVNPSVEKLCEKTVKASN